MRAWLSIAGPSAFILGSCSSTLLLYHPESAGGNSGYAEQRLPQDRYLITYTAPRGSTIAAVDYLALWRAAEFTITSDYRGFIVLDRTVTRDVYVLPGADGTRITYRGGYNEWQSYWRVYCRGKHWRDCGNDPIAPSGGKLNARIEVAYTIGLSNATDGLVIDARALLANLAAEKPRSVAVGTTTPR